MPSRAPGKDLVAFIRDVSGEGLALGLSPAAASAAGFSAVGPSAASGIWEKVEILPWTLLHPQPPSWEGAACTVRWRFHVVDLRAKPTEFHAGNKNTWRFNDGAGYWSQMKVLPGILTVEMYMERTLPLQVELGVMRNAPSEPEVRAVLLSDQLCMCLEHRRPELGLHCLCPEALLEANAPLPPPSEVSHWPSTAEYMASWRPAVDLEAAASAADEDDTRILYNVEITWGEKSGSFLVPSSLASAHRMKLRGLVQGLDGPTERASGWLCLRRFDGFHRGAGWSGHAGLVGAELVSDDGNAQPLEVSVGEEDAQIPQTMSLRMTFRMIPGTSDATPKAGQRKAGYVVEFIPKSLPYSCMAVALAELSMASQLLQQVILQGFAPLLTKRTQAEGDWHVDGEATSRGVDLKP